MRSTNILYSFFIGLALLFWNPLGFYLLYGSTPVYAFKLIHALYWVMFVAGMLAILLIRKNKLKERAKNVLLIISYTTLFFAVLVLINHAIEPVQKCAVPKAYADPETQGLLFKPNSTLKHSTVEYDYTATMNSLGLRGKEISQDKGNAYRILCFGDSWTFGWGVNNTESWPAKLESDLHTAGIKNVEVINCGRPGQYTTDYKNNMQRIVPFLKPDFVLVGVLQLDDLLQLFENDPAYSHEKTNANKPATLRNKLKFAAMGYLNYSLGNLIGLFRKDAAKTVVLGPADMKASCNEFINSLNYIQKVRFLNLEDTVQALFKSGQLNPGLLRYYIDFPDAARTFNNPQHAFTKRAIIHMDADVRAMKTMCDQNHCRLVFVNLPYNIFTGHTVVRTPDDLMNPYFERNNKLDSMYRACASKNNIAYLELTDHFKALANKTDYFFLYDGHPTKRGYEEIGSSVRSQLIEQQLIQLYKQR